MRQFQHIEPAGYVGACHRAGHFGRKLYNRSGRIVVSGISQRWLRDLAPGLTPRSVLDKFRAVQMIDVHLPTTDGRQVILSRYTQPEKELQLLLNHLKLQLPEQPPPKITTAAVARAT